MGCNVLFEKDQKDFFDNPPSPLALKGLHLTLYSLPLREGTKIVAAETASPELCFCIAGRRDILFYQAVVPAH